MFLPCFCSHVQRKQGLVSKAGSMLISITSILFSVSVLQAQIAPLAKSQNLAAEAGDIVAPTARAAQPEPVAVRSDTPRPDAALIVESPLETPASSLETRAMPEPSTPNQPLIPVNADSVRSGQGAGPALVDEQNWPTYFSIINAALAEVETARGRFTQLDPDGGIATGVFALRRPGRLRFEYDAPNPVLIVSDGVTVAISDSDLETVDRLPLQSTPLKFLLDDRIDFDDSVETLKIVEGDGFVSLTVRDSSGDVDGELTLIMSSGDYDLIGWIAVGSDGDVTHVNLETEQMNARLSSALFRLDPEFEDDDEDVR